MRLLVSLLMTAIVACDGDDGAAQCGEGSQGSAACRDDWFACADGGEVPPTWECDGQMDCDDGSDEEPGHCDYAAFWVCGNGTFVYAGDLCDDEDHCGNGADESPALCHPFACGDSGETIATGDVCDGVDDCGDSSDEDATLCATCYGGPLFPCPTSCLRMSDVCNHQDDCDDGSDEWGCEH